MCNAGVKLKKFLFSTTIIKHLRFTIEYSIFLFDIMARPIAETPVLYGEDAQRFESIIKSTQPYAKEKKEQLRKTYENFKRKVKILM